MNARLAKRLVEPTWLTHPIYVETFGPEVCEIAALAGLPPYPEQELVLNLLFAIGPDGKSVAFEVDVVAARQVMKTGTILQAELGWLYVTDQKLVVHSAHELSTTEEAFVDLANLIESTPILSNRLAPTRGERPGISEGNGRWAIELATGQRIKYKARTKGGGRGLTGWKVVLDEKYAVLPTHMGALLPTLTSVPDPQVLGASSAGKVESAVLRDTRDRGREKLTPRQVYVEWGDKEAWTGCADEECTHAKNATGCALDDEKRWFKIIPGLGTRISLDTIRSMRQSMPPEEFLREFMVWWDDPDPNAVEDPPAIDLDGWLKLAKPKAAKPKKATIVLDVSPDRKSSTIGIASDGPGAKTLVLIHSAGGTAWVVPKLQRILAKRDVLEVALHPAGATAVLVPELVAAGIEFETLTAQQAGAACGFFQDAVERKRVVHVGQDELDQAVMNARIRNSGEADFWDRRDRSINISPVVAASQAAYRWAEAKKNAPAIPSASYLGGGDDPAATRPGDPRGSDYRLGWRRSGK